MPVDEIWIAPTTRNVKEELEALTKMFDYLSESLNDIGSKKAVFAVGAAKSVMLHEFYGKEI